MASSFLLSNQRFSAFFWTQFLGALNDNVFKNALVMMVTFQNATVWGLDKGQVVPLAGGLFILPFFLFSPLAGQVSDRMEKSRLVRVTKYWEILIMLVAAWGFYQNHFGLLLVVLFLAGVQATLFGPVKYSILPELVAPEQLLNANALVEGGTFLAILFGTLLGGALLRWPAGDTWVAWTLVALALAGAWTATRVPMVSAGDPTLKVRLNPLPSFFELWRMLRRLPAVRQSVLGISWFWFFGAALLSILPLYCKDLLGVNETVVTLLLTAFTFGIGLGSLLCARLSAGRIHLRWAFYSGLGMTLFLADLVLVRPEWSQASLVTLPQFLSTWTGWRLLLDFLLMCLCGGLFVLPLYALMQERSPREERSRVVAANNILNAIYMVGSSLLVMALGASQVSYPSMFGVLAVLNLMALGHPAWRLSRQGGALRT